MRKCVYDCPPMARLSSLWSILSASASNVRYSNLVTFIFVSFTADGHIWQTIKCYYFPFFTIDSTANTTQEPQWLRRLQPLSWSFGGRRENTNRQIQIFYFILKEVLKDLFLNSDSGLKQTAPHWVIFHLWCPVLLSQAASPTTVKKNKVSVWNLEPPARDEVVN